MQEFYNFKTDWEQDLSLPSFNYLATWKYHQIQIWNILQMQG